MKALLQTERAEVFFYAANGHGGWEAVIANLVGAGTAILVPGTGHFSDSWAEQVEAFGGEALRTPYVEGHADRSGGGRSGAARRQRAAHRRGVRRPHRHRQRHHLATWRRCARAIDAAGHPALFVVDVVASLAAAPFAMDALGVDVAIGASQKGLMLPPGLAFVAADERALAVGRATRRAALLLGLGAAAQRSALPQVLRHAAASPTWPGSRRRSR